MTLHPSLLSVIACFTSFLFCSTSSFLGSFNLSCWQSSNVTPLNTDFSSYFDEPGISMNPTPNSVLSRSKSLPIHGLTRSTPILRRSSGSGSTLPPRRRRSAAPNLPPAAWVLISVDSRRLTAGPRDGATSAAAEAAASSESANLIVTATGSRSNGVDYIYQKEG